MVWLLGGTAARLNVNQPATFHLTARPAARSRPHPSGGNPVRSALGILTTLASSGASREIAMQTLAQRCYLESEFGAHIELPVAGSSLENPYVYDASARELEAMASDGLIRVVDQRCDGRVSGLISRLTFERLR
jgi:hypothetical protein